jgi:hypothetical protein
MKRANRIAVKRKAAKLLFCFTADLHRGELKAHFIQASASPIFKTKGRKFSSKPGGLPSHFVLGGPPWW